MSKIFILFIIGIVGLTSAGHPGFKEYGHKQHGQGKWRSYTQLGTKLCSNLTSAQAYLTQTQALITTLANNGSFTSIAQQRAQEFTYIKGATSAALQSNCTGVFAGIDAARALDSTAARTAAMYTQIAAKQLNGIITNITGYIPNNSHEH